ALGSVRQADALPVYWQAAKRDVCVVEFLTNLGTLAGKDAYFLFAPAKLKGCHGGPGRALALQLSE
ncbi:MAG TPA: hypothetical protein PLV92_30445, partial [Pirellulaceae bacterium]|nr:hypothetical protein [Pirellulaceae bacterium]